MIKQADKARDWVVNCAAPFWYSYGIDWKQGGFYDALDLDSFTNSANRKRLRTATRQIYAFSEASRMGFHEGKAAVEHGLEFLYSKARNVSGGYLSHFDLNCDPLSKDQDTYDLAFVLFSLAHSYRLLRQEREREEGLHILQYLNTEFRHPIAGFLEGSPHRGPRRQNPHMHLLEASLAWLPFDETGGFRRLADELVSVFEQHFLCERSGAICEFFDESLLRQPEIPEVVEPGHLLEWIWLLTQYFRAAGNSKPYLAQIYKFAHAFGKNSQTGLLFGELDIRGNPLGSTVRLWPHTEWVRAEVSALEAGLCKDTMQFEQATNALWRFLDAAPVPGLWLERHDKSRDQFLFEPAPATSLYHIVGAFSALAAARQPSDRTTTPSLKEI
ncbi:AGE family epimerase/isomerase [Bradyrhizobium sp. NC92]|uniref:AGE family epimerase/isomerase n=1 Tax=Bradyrhizobium sp. (strain NC92) TaxID=55395 RepID=UPI0021AA58A1|nr:AGE family epimerase/isomerase [Bradyrhizobium sp. NC92]UWU67618.1 AGE family epimerase/isomerase [Bradyrhizobium sp. NC92]